MSLGLGVLKLVYDGSSPTGSGRPQRSWPDGDLHVPGGHSPRMGPGRFSLRLTTACGYAIRVGGRCAVVGNRLVPGEAGLAEAEAWRHSHHQLT